jgi:hypothetical protein
MRTSENRASAGGCPAAEAQDRQAVASDASAGSGAGANAPSAPAGRPRCRRPRTNSTAAITSGKSAKTKNVDWAFMPASMRTPASQGPMIAPTFAIDVAHAAPLARMAGR